MRLAAVWIALAGVSCSGTGDANPPEPIRPDIVEFGTGLSAMQARLAERCGTLRTRVIDPPFLEDVREVQHQIDCDGLEYFGEARWAEFVFRDRVLEMVWIMVDADDQDRIIAAMRSAYRGERSNAEYVAFPVARAAWRYEPPEVLFYSETLAPAIETYFAE